MGLHFHSSSWHGFSKAVRKYGMTTVRRSRLLWRSPRVFLAEVLHHFHTDFVEETQRLTRSKRNVLRNFVKRFWEQDFMPLVYLTSICFLSRYRPLGKVYSFWWPISMPSSSNLTRFQENILPGFLGTSSNTQSLCNAQEPRRPDLNLSSMCSMPTLKSFSSKHSAAFCIIDWPKNKLTSRENRKPIRRTKNSNRLMSCTINFFTSPNGYGLNSYAGTMPLILAALGAKRRCVSIEQDTNCFKAALARSTFVCSSVCASSQNYKCSSEELISKWKSSWPLF